MVLKWRVWVGTDSGSYVGFAVGSAKGSYVDCTEGSAKGSYEGVGDGDCFGSAEGKDVDANCCIKLQFLLGSIFGRWIKLALKGDDAGDVTDLSILSRSVF